MRRFMQVVLGINIALVGVVDLIGYIFHLGPVARVAAAEPILARQYAAVALAYAVVLLFFVWPRFQRDPVWLLFPATFLIALWLDAVYELAAGTGLVSENLPPTIVRAILVACYVAGYLVLTRRAAGAAQASGSSMSPTAR